MTWSHYLGKQKFDVTLASLVSLQQGNVKKSEKLMKTVDTQKDNVDTFFSILYFMSLQIFYLQIYK